MESRFGFVHHYLNTELLFAMIPSIRRVSDNAVRSIIPYLPPYRLMNIGPAVSRDGSVATGVGVVCSLLPYHFASLPHARVLKKIVSAVQLCERHGARIVGLGGFTSVFGNEGQDIARYVDVPITSGNTYTAWLAIEGVKRAASILEQELERSVLAVFGATGDIGSICASVLSQQVQTIRLVARNDERLKQIAEKIRRRSKCQVQICKSTREASKNADIILTVTSALTTLIEPAVLKAGAIVCDVAYPANIPREIARDRTDIFAFEGGMSTFPHYDALDQNQREKLEWYNPPGTIHGCLAETILLSLSKKYAYFSFGRGNITEDKLAEVAQMADEHGFGLAPFHWGEHIYSSAEIEAIRRQMRQTSIKAIVSC